MNEERGQVLDQTNFGFTMADTPDNPQDSDLQRQQPLSDAELAEHDRPIYELLGIELRFAPEHLAPPVDEERLKAFVRKELSADDRSETIDLIATFQSWYKAFGDVLRQSPGRRHSELP